VNLDDDRSNLRDCACDPDAGHVGIKLCRTSRAVPAPPKLMRSVQTQILALFLLLVVVVQIGGFVLINTAGVTAAHKSVSAEIAAGTHVFERSLQQDTLRLVQGARLLTADYAFREAAATQDAATVASVLANHGKRIDASLMMLVGLDRRVIADTMGNATGQPFPFPELLEHPESSQQAPEMVVLHGDLYQLVIVPVLAPLPVAWLAAGFQVDNAFAEDLHRLTRLQVSFLTRNARDGFRVQASTLASASRSRLATDMSAGRLADNAMALDTSGGSDEPMTHVVDLSARSNERIVAVLQEPLSVALEPFRQLQRRLTLISLLGIAVSILASIGIARGVGRPVRELAGIARRIAAGDYSGSTPATRNDEIGDLAAAFRSMQQGIVAREARISDLAFRDVLTGLPNRAQFAERLQCAVMTGAGDATPAVAVLLMDPDHFKYVNDTLGHAIGDLLLKEVAARLNAVVRRTSDTVARLGGDEFAVLLPGASVAEAQRAGEAIQRVLEAPMTLEGHVVDARASIGLVACPAHGDDPSQLLRRADVAMYEAKRGNRGIVAWDDQYERHGVERLSLMSDLRTAVDTDQLALVYQPKTSLGETPELHAEVLVRWNHPTRGLVPPADFIPFAEQTGYIRVITQWVIRRAIAQCAVWRGQGVAMNLAINLSARDVVDAELPERLQAVLDAEKACASWFTFEITESAILDDPGHAARNLERLHALGCRLAIDDYGTGYSSLAYLRRLPVQEIKIDKSFVTALARDASDEIIVRSTVELGHNMGLVVVAEGVEDEATFARLRALDCDMAQGYWISRPLGLVDFEAWLRRRASPQPSRERAILRRVS